MADGTPAPRINSGGSKKFDPDEEMAAVAKPAPSKEKSKDQPAPTTTTKTTGFDVMRPVRYVASFVGGTVSHTLDGAAIAGRHGSMVGMGIGLALLFLAPGVALGLEVSGLMALLVFGGGGAIAGMAGGAAIGAAMGLITGGVRGVRNEMKGEPKTREVSTKGGGLKFSMPSFSDFHEDQQERSSINFDRLQQQNRENQTDYGSYWQDRVNSEPTMHRGKGY